MEGRPPERPSLAKLIEAGLDSARLVFGVDGVDVGAPELADAGAGHFVPGGGDPAVGALLTNDRTTVELVYGAVRAGGRLVSLPLPGRSVDPIAYAAFVRESCRAHGVTRVVARDDIAALLESVGIDAVPHSALRDRPLAEPDPSGFALVQFSSGSTADPKGVVLDDHVLGVNVEAMLTAVGPRPGDATVSWLPLSHDMGLVGMLLTSTAAGDSRWVGEGTIVLLDPERFLRRPQTWLDALSHWSGSFTAAPDFGYRLATRRRPTGALDLSRLRCAVLGGEIIRADTLQAVVGALGHVGLRADALCPAYGMAELGLAATFTRPGRAGRVEEVDTAALAAGRRQASPGVGPTTTIVASGTPLEGYEVQVSAEADAIAPISIVAPAVGWDPARGRSYAEPDGRFLTGDLGFVDDDGWVYVCGRSDDHIVANGRTVHAPSIEAAVSLLPGVRDGRVTVVDSPSGDWLVAFEATGHATVRVRQLVLDIRRACIPVAAGRPTEVIPLAAGQLPMTPSGKVQRHEVRRRWLTGSLQSVDDEQPVGPSTDGAGPLG